MAATKRRLTKTQQDQIRDAIKTSQLVNRLQYYALDELGPQGEKVELDRGRLDAIRTLLAKTLPDLKAIEHSGNVGMIVHIEADARKL